MLQKNERLDDLQFKNLKIIQETNGFCFGIDSILLSDFAKDIKKDSIVCDLGTGTGILGLLLCKKTKLKKIFGIEVQKRTSNIAKKNVKLNNLENKFEIIEDNIKNLNNIFSNNYFDSIITNPPYKKLGSGILNDNKIKLISRHEIEANLEDFIKISSKLLKSSGNFYIVHKTERLVDLLFLLRIYNLEPKKIQFIHSTYNKAPNLVLIKATKNANEFLKIEQPLIIYNNDGTYTNEILKIYNKL